MCPLLLLSWPSSGARGQSACDVWVTPQAPREALGVKEGQGWWELEEGMEQRACVHFRVESHVPHTPDSEQKLKLLPGLCHQLSQACCVRVRDSETVKTFAAASLCHQQLQLVNSRGLWTNLGGDLRLLQ